MTGALSLTAQLMIELPVRYASLKLIVKSGFGAAMGEEPGVPSSGSMRHCVLKM